MKAYKGFTKEMKCRDFQYEEGGEYEQSGEIKCCENGFHACEDPIDCFNYYSPADSVYHEVELDGNIVKEKYGSDTKVAASKIKIGAELNFFGIAKAHVEWIKKNIKKIKSNRTQAIRARQRTQAIGARQRTQAIGARQLLRGKIVLLLLGELKAKQRLLWVLTLY